MRKPISVRSLEQLGRVRLSSSFFMRDFLHSEIADMNGIPNIPDDPTVAIAAGRRLERAKLRTPHLGSAGRSGLHGRAGHSRRSVVCRSIC